MTTPAGEAGGDDEDVPAPVRRALACRACAPHLPLGPRPILRVDPRARVVIASQAPGLAAHRSGVPWDDRSGDAFRDWLGVDRATFYDRACFAVLPMGFCYPGRAKGGDAPPRPECAPLWRAPLLEVLSGRRLLLAVGRFSQTYHLGGGRTTSLTETVRAYREHLPDVFPLPHPSPRTTPWRRKNPWFEAEVVPALRREVARALG